MSGSERGRSQRYRRVIPDTNALLVSLDLKSMEGEVVVPSSVLGEIGGVRRSIIDALVSSNTIKVMDPDPESRRVAEDAYRAVGGRGVSPTDLDIIALAIKLSREGEVVVYTDDYAIQNILSFLGIPYQRVVQRGISGTYMWIKVCPTCGRAYRNVEMEVCPVCGSKLIAVPKKVKRLGGPAH